MESMISIVKLLLKDVSSKRILDGKVELRNFTKEEFMALLEQKFNRMSGNDAEQLYYYLLTTLEREKGKGQIFDKDGFSVLDAMKEYVNQVLEQTQGAPVCKYRRLLAWRMITSKIEEDTFTTAFLAIQDTEKPWSKRTNYDWRTVIGHNNYELNNLLRKGMVENHFHLKGSAPYFAITWLNLMNDINNKSFIKRLDEFDSHRMINGINPAWEGYEPSYVELHLQAALIRCYLYCRLSDKKFDIFDSYLMNVSDIKQYIDFGTYEISIEKNKVDEVLNRFEKAGYEKIRYYEFWRSLLQKAEIAEGTDKDLFWRAVSETVSKEQSFEIAYLRAHLNKNLLKLEEVAQLFWLQLSYIHIPKNKIEILICREKRKRFVEKNDFSTVYYYLTTPGVIFEIRDELQDFINEFRSINKAAGINCYKGENWVYDYITHRSLQEREKCININRTERWFLYSMFSKLYSGDERYYPLGNMFYAYLIIKEKIRSELVQVNNKKGFDNFLKYQDRKEYFIDGTKYEHIYSKIALEDTWQYQKESLHKLEARISPKDTAEADKKAIQKLDDALKRIDKEIKERTFYVFHFVKAKDVELTSGKQQCRHYRKRNEIRKKALAIEEFRRRNSKEASRVFGIDACSPEIGCRPEVFAQAFTYLRGMEEGADRYHKSVPRLGISYHVGEDFLDIVDGLRAIDEAIHFLQLDSGDRLGHALALGVSPAEWYEFKGRRVLMTKQDHLDDIVWIYMKIRKYNIRHSESMLQELHRQFIHCMQEIYGTEISCDINVYYDAWKLRGDDPEKYLSYEWEWGADNSEWDYFAYNNCYPENAVIRKQVQCRTIYSMYHFDDRVKRKGEEIVECKVTRELMEVITQIQKQLQKEVAKMGISIETNPSSNYMIGTLERYDQHPIRNFYNKGLTVDYEELLENPQIDVTINTDDQAIFSTNLENEYAYIALSLEKLRNENGEVLYKRSMIYEWLNNIRRNSKKVCFNQKIF